MFDIGSVPSPSGPSQNASDVDPKTSSVQIGSGQGGADATIPSPKESSVTSIRAKKRKNNVDDDQGRKRQLTYDVWNHFNREFVKGEWKAICKYCKKALSGEHGTKSLREARKELATMIILHKYPLSMVEHVGFRRFTETIQPLFKPVSRNTIKKVIMDMYDFEKTNSMSLLEACKSRIAITTDMWTSENQKKGFMVVTTHFIDESWVLQNRIMRFAYVPHPHTAKDLANELIDTIVEWNIDRKLSTVTVDNCSTNDSMLKKIEEKLFGEHLVMEGKLLHMRCSAHILNLIVKDGLEVIGKAIDNIRDSVAYWKATAKRIEDFHKMARKLKNPTTKNLILDCRTRWNSTYMMLDVTLCYKDVFPSMKLKDKKYTCLLLNADWDMAKVVCGKLKTFYDASVLFSGTAYLTANGFFSLLMGIMAVASVLDPRYKLVLGKYFYEIIYGPLGEDEVQAAIDNVEDFCKVLFNEYANAKSYRTNEENSIVCTTTCNVSDHLSQFDVYVQKTVSATPQISELTNYLSEPVKPRTPDFDVLAWWKVNARDFPTLALIARDVLAIPLSTVASESAFSTSGRFVSPHRSRLHPKTLEALMCAQDWLWSQIKDRAQLDMLLAVLFLKKWKRMRSQHMDKEPVDYYFKEDYTIVPRPRAIVYRDRNDQRKLMRLNELHKFSDGTLTRVMEKLDHMVKDFHLYEYNKGMETRKWSEDDKRRSKDFITAIKKRLQIRRIYRSLESFDTYPILLSFTHCGNKSILRVLRIILVILPEHPSETIVFHNEDGNPARANIKQALGYLKDGDGDGNSQPHKGVKASANSDVMYSFTSAQDGDPLQDDSIEEDEAYLVDEVLEGALGALRDVS
ncbi:zinc finger BED domain-containing protein RICESLEEPER 2-like protein [Tanacetum coccineum]